jgi:hypothetical protein
LQATWIRYFCWNRLFMSNKIVWSFSKHLWTCDSSCAIQPLCCHDNRQIGNICHSHNSSWRTMGLWDVKDPTLSWQSAQDCGEFFNHKHRPLSPPEIWFLCFWYWFL